MEAQVQIVYVGFADTCIRIGQESGTRYSFSKDRFKRPIPTSVYETDAEGLIQERKQPCRFKANTVRLFLTLDEWERVLSGETQLEFL